MVRVYYVITAEDREIEHETWPWLGLLIFP